METLTHTQVRDYYGTTLQSAGDLKTSACCPSESVPEHHRPILSLLPDEVLAKFYGCGSPIPAALDGATVLDLGCGTGRDAFVAAALAGPAGRVIGVDMTPEQVEVAKRHREAVADALGHPAPTTEFRLGLIEDLGALGVEDESVDVVISNCVLNLAPDKEPVFREIWRVLKPGGELYASDVFADRRLPEAIRRDPVLVGECLGGALYTEDFRRLMARLGWADVRTVAESPITVEDPALRDALGAARFVSRTARAFKLPGLVEDACEDYGQMATYRGGVEGQRHAFVLDDHHTFEAGRPALVCGNTAAMLQETRFAPFFDVTGDRSTHFGLFDCAPAPVGGGAATESCC
ncbi:methyltransferase domain-containing protein [Rubrivirga sp. S365]|uniref:Arsenite methyltransferase n=1 Tax=Rubrivirga litoralis TaxID=3075598 RepID=A0ABU3BLI1_9BACT|nr:MULTISPECIES: methyltransferase domain-containing protein [unclassified Rubrivirga]MDT0630147.1 methyltransferase domain-containing protein [Rubrivirga sp. F394]MDT7855658.1 methyltransferase domain-containing protein [Rubrivirga sp. S365]